MSSGVHAGHRQRIKDRFLAGGLEVFSDHEVFELILFYAIPRRDVNEISHRLIETFGSYKGVFDADYEDLCAVEGIGENAAILIKLMSESFRRYAFDDIKDVYYYDSIKKIGDYAVKLYIGVSVEKLYLMLLDNNMKLLDTVMLAEGNINNVGASIRTICEKALRKNATTIVLIHNHPGGKPYPSDEDRRLSNYFREFLKTFEITLYEHIIVSGRFFYPVFEGEVYENEPVPKPFSYGKAFLSKGVRLDDPDPAGDILCLENS